MWNSHISFILGIKKPQQQPKKASRIYKPKGNKPEKSTLHKHIFRYDKRAGCSKKKVLLLFNFYDQMPMNVVVQHLQHKLMPYPQFQQPLFYWITSQSFYLSSRSLADFFFFFPPWQKINRIWHDLPSFFGWPVLLLFPFSCLEKFLFFSSLTFPLLEFLYHSSLLSKLYLFYT